MVRRNRLDDRNDHQRATVERLAGRPGLMIAMDETELPGVLDEAAAIAAAGGAGGEAVPPFAEDRLIAALRQEIMK